MLETMNSERLKAELEGDWDSASAKFLSIACYRDAADEVNTCVYFIMPIPIFVIGIKKLLT